MSTQPPHHPADGPDAPQGLPAPAESAADEDDALRWEGDESDGPIARPPRRDPNAPVPLTAADADGVIRTSSAGLIVTGVLAGVALLETIGWVRGVFGSALADTIDAGTGTPLEVLTFALNIGGRVAAVVAPALWLGLVLWRGSTGLRRVSWLALGALLLVPWPALVHA